MGISQIFRSLDERTLEQKCIYAHESPQEILRRSTP